MVSKKNKIGISLLGLMLLLFSAAFAIRPSPSLATGLQADGKAIFESKCATCHGKDGSGNTPAGKKLGTKDLRSADVQKLSNAQLAKIISDGKGKMPAYGKTLDANKINQVAAYIHGLGH